MNYISYLKKIKMIGEFDPWKTNNGKPYYALLVAVDIALEECKAWSKQDISRSEFLSHLKNEDVLVFGNVEDFVEWKKNRKNPSAKRFKRNISEERRNALRKHAEDMRSKLGPSISENA